MKNGYVPTQLAATRQGKIHIFHMLLTIKKVRPNEQQTNQYRGFLCGIRIATLLFGPPVIFMSEDDETLCDEDDEFEDEDIEEEEDDDDEDDKEKQWNNYGG